jgi:hypothetical protein
VSPLAKEVIKKLSEEHDAQVLAEVLDFYEYLKQKKQKELQRNGLVLKKMNQTMRNKNM